MLAVDQILKLALAGADAIDVPGGDLHRAERLSYAAPDVVQMGGANRAADPRGTGTAQRAAAGRPVGMAVLHASPALARRVDLSEIGFCALAARAGEPGGADSLIVGGGQALFAHAGSPLNKVLGLGLGQDVSDADLDAIDDFYDRRGVDAQVELCPLATSGLAARLVGRGYVVQAFENE